MTPPIRDDILRWYQSGLDAVAPEVVTRKALGDVKLGPGKLVVLSIGKAAVPMAQAAHEIYGERIHQGLIVTKRGQLTDDVQGFDAVEAGHPVPDEHSLTASGMAFRAVSGLTAEDTVIALISGGGSSLLEKPIADMSLMDLQLTTELLMYAGAGIHDLNAVRKSLSAVKGGGLRCAMGPAMCTTLLLSDVLGNNPSIVASGPTIVERVSRARAREIVAQYGLEDRVPKSVRRVLEADLPPTIEVDNSNDCVKVIADNAVFVEQIKQAAMADGMNVDTVWRAYAGDARDLGVEIVKRCEQAHPDVDVLIGGGEATSVVRGAGKGGRNTETALMAAVRMNSGDWTIASLASDGDDGNSGAAGAIVDASTVEGDPWRALERSDSASYLASRGALVITGPSGTNVNDVYLAVRNAALGKGQG